MKCENIYCIFQKEKKCFFDNIHLGVMGECTDCVYVNFDEKELEKLKKEARKGYLK